MGGGGQRGVRGTGDSVIGPCFKHLAHLKGCRWEGGSGTSLEQYIPCSSTSQVVPEDTEAERSTTSRASHLPRSLEVRKRVTRVGGVRELKG